MIHASILIFIIHALLILGLSYSMKWSQMISRIDGYDDRMRFPLSYNDACNSSAEKVVKWSEAYRTLNRVVKTEQARHGGGNSLLGVIAAAIGCVIANSFLLKSMSLPVSIIITVAVTALALFLGGALVTDLRDMSVNNLERTYKSLKSEETCTQILQDAKIDPDRFSPFDYYVVATRAEYLETAAPAYLFASRMGTIVAFICYILGIGVIPALF